MPESLKVRRNYLRSLSQVSRDSESDEVLAGQIKEARRAYRAMRPVFERLGLSSSLSGISSIRVRATAITILAGSAAVKKKLYQVLPSLQEKTAAAGFLQPVKVAIFPGKVRLRRRPEPQGKPRSATPEAAARMKNRAALVSDPSLREALIRLAQALEDAGQKS